MDRRSLITGSLAGVTFASALPYTLAKAVAEDAKAKGVYSAPGLSFSALFLANAKKLWTASGVDAQLRQVQGGPLAMASLTNKEADFAGVASTDPVVGWDKGIKTIAVAAFTGSLAMQFTARNDWMEKLGIGPNSPLADKIKAFKGVRIGASTIGGGPAQYTRHLARTAGLDPETDMKILAVGFGASRMAALRTNQVDVTVGDAPEADQIELEGFGKLFINCASEVPSFEEFPYTVLSVTPEFADRNADVLRKIVHAVGQGNNMIYDRFGEAVDVLKTVFPTIPAAAIERALSRDRNSYPKDGRMTETMWKNNLKIAQELKMISTPISSAEGHIWTNKFIS